MTKIAAIILMALLALSMLPAPARADEPGNLVIVSCDADSAFSPAFSGDQACDGSNEESERWISGNATNEHWLRINFTRSYAVVNVTVFWGENAAAQLEKTYIQAFVGGAWVNHTGPIDAESNAELTYRMDAPTATSSVRIVGSVGSASEAMQIREVSASGSPGESFAQFDPFFNLLASPVVVMGLLLLLVLAILGGWLRIRNR